MPTASEGQVEREISQRAKSQVFMSSFFLHHSAQSHWQQGNEYEREKMEVFLPLIIFSSVRVVCQMSSLNQQHQPQLRIWQKHKFSDPTLDLPDQNSGGAAYQSVFQKPSDVILMNNLSEKPHHEAQTGNLGGVCVCVVLHILNIYYFYFEKRDGKRQILDDVF